MLLDIIGIGIGVVFITVVLLCGVSGLWDGYDRQKRRNKKWKK